MAIFNYVRLLMFYMGLVAIVWSYEAIKKHFFVLILLLALAIMLFNLVDISLANLRFKNVNPAVYVQQNKFPAMEEV